MAAASIGFVPPAARPGIRVRNLASWGVSGSGFLSAEKNSRRVWIRCCSAASVEDPVEGISSSSSRNRLPRLVGMGSKLVGCGSAVPKLQISNDDLAQFVETSDEWISVRTGIRNRRVLTGNETLNGLAVEAANGALQMAGVEAENVDVVIMCTSTPDDLFGGAAQIQKDLGCKSAWAFDITAACSGFIVGLITATRFLKGGGYQNILVIGADALSRFVDWTDRGSCILFGDAAGAVLVQANQRIIDAVATRLEIPSEKVISNLAHYGNTSAASIPLALDEAVRSGRVKAGDTIATAGFGAGLTWGSAVVRWG